MSSRETFVRFEAAISRTGIKVVHPVALIDGTASDERVMPCAGPTFRGASGHWVMAIKWGCKTNMERLIMDTMPVLQHKKLLRVGEAAEILNVSRWTVYRWVEAGRLGGTRLGAGSLRILSHTVAALIDRHYVGVTTPAIVE